jgi:hypothetical protein
MPVRHAGNAAPQQAQRNISPEIKTLPGNTEKQSLTRAEAVA